MRVHSATLAGSNNNQDRLFVTDHAVIVLDGASAFAPGETDAGHYAETLGAVIAEQLDHHPGVSIADAVAAGIRHVTQKLDLSAGSSPSSTVSVLRCRPDAIDLYILGDSPIHLGNDTTEHVLTDVRMAAVGIAERKRYVRQLRAGHGYDDSHRAALVDLQRAQRRARNQPGGYWIAEIDPQAAHHGLTTAIAPDAITWAVLATDGAADLINHAGLSRPDTAHHESGQLAEILGRLHKWEARTDPDGAYLPRAKQHGDKTIVAVVLESCAILTLKCLQYQVQVHSKTQRKLKIERGTVNAYR